VAIRYKYSLRNCNPPEKKTRKKINELDFKMKFPFYSFDKDRIDISLVRRFLYQNKITANMLYTKEQIEQQLRDEKKFFVKEDIETNNRFEILDLREE